MSLPRRWRRPEPRRTWQPPAPIPDGDTVPVAGWPRWADLLDQTAEPTACEEPPDDATADRNHWLAEATRALPVYRPLLTPGQLWRSAGGWR